MTGTTISHYKILEKLGEGGMGIVYKAEDTRLDRIVALKVLAAHLLSDEEARQRFEREAKAAAGLDNPNIATVFEIGEDKGQSFIALQFVDGPTVADKIAERPLPLEEALDIAIQVAEGLQEAHEKGVIHRDIKAANILLDSKGRAKITDFGLAHLAERSRLTKSGTTLGTPAYMSPEQAQGQATDHRSDIWSFGVLIYEMVTGKHPFPGEYEQAVVYGIINEKPEPVTALRKGLQTKLDDLLEKALAKDPAGRYQHVEEMLVDLRALGGKPQTVVAPAPPVRRLATRERLAGALLAAALVAGLIAAFSPQPPPAGERPAHRWSFAPEELSTLFASAVISPDGKRIAYRAGPGQFSLWIRDLNYEEPRRLARTEGAGAAFFWSPDSRWISFVANSQLQKLPLDGTPPTVISDVMGVQNWGGSWSPDGKTIAFRSARQLFEVSSNGGEVEPLLVPQDLLPRGTPVFLPLGRGARRAILQTFQEGDSFLELLNLETGASERLVRGALSAYSPSGHILFDRQHQQGGGSVYALPFDLETGQATGEPFLVVERGGRPSVSRDGTLIYLESGLSSDQRLVWRDRGGQEVGEIGQPQPGMEYPVLSPDDRRVAVAASEGTEGLEVWVHNTERPIKRRLTFNDRNRTRPQWSATGAEITYQGQGYDLYQRNSDGTDEAKPLLVSDEANDRPYSWSRDGKFLVFTRTVAGAHRDIWYVERQEDGEMGQPTAFLETPFYTNAPHLSPDGRHIAYCSNQSGSDQVFVREFPSGEAPVQVSSSGGCQPRWSRDGKELFYVVGQTMMAVKVETSPSFRVLETETLFSHLYLRVANAEEVMYDVSADGRFVTMDAVEGSEATPATIHVVQNWYEEFRERN